MKKIIILLAIVCSFYVANAQNSTAPMVSTVTGHVIAPFTITPAAIISDLPAIAQGTTNTYGSVNPENRILFNMTKSANKYVRLNLTLPMPVNGVSLDAFWFFHDAPPSDNYAFPSNPINQNFDWYGTATSGYISVNIRSVTATETATLGVQDLIAYCEGYYYGL